jgi:hypothetical protein
MTDTPKLLLAHHLKTLKLPTVLREFDKVAQQCAAEGLDPAATAEAWVDGHVHAFDFFGRVPLSVLYDNDRCLVTRIHRQGLRARSAAP